MSGGRDQPAAAAELSDRAIELLRAVALRVEVARRLEFGAGEAVLRSIVDATVVLFDAEAASIALYDPVEDRLVFRVAAGERGQGVVGLSVPSAEGLVGYVFTTGQPLALSDVASDARFGRAFAEQTSYLPRGMVAVPLLDNDGTIGVLEVLDKRDLSAFTLRDIELASAFAAQAAVAIRASRVERDTVALLGSALRGLLGAHPSQSSVGELVAAAISARSEGDEGRLWALADAVARLRHADPGRLELLTEIIAVLVRQAERDRPAGDRLGNR